MHVRMPYVLIKELTYLLTYLWRRDATAAASLHTAVLRAWYRLRQD